MSKIESIKNVTVFNDLSVGNDFSQSVFVNNGPDECVIRSICYAGTSADVSGMYLVWCDLVNDFVGSFPVGKNVANDAVIVNVCPQTRIFLNHQPIPANCLVRFMLYQCSGNKQAIPATLTGDLAINMDFIKYKK